MMSNIWTEGVFKLIEQQQGEQGIQEQLEGLKENKLNLCEKLSIALAKVGLKKSGEQWRNKVKKLRAEYKKNLR